MKKIIFLVLFTLQFSLFCFSQSDTLHHYTDEEILKISNYVKELESKVSLASLSESDKENRAQIAGFFIKTPHSYTNNEILKLAAYIKHLENPTAFVGNTPSDSLTYYTNPEIAKFAKYIGDIEKRIAGNNELQPDPEEKQKITALLSRPSSDEYNDSEIIMLANYIKGLEKLDSLNTIAIAKAYNDSVALAVVVPIKTEEEKKIDEIAKLIFFNFDSSSIKAESYKPLEEVVKLMKSQIEFKFVVEGYCDSVGSSAYNLSLSNRRAGSVKRYFISKGVPANRISAIGYGEENPIATNMTEEGRAKNRRVEIKAKK